MVHYSGFTRWLPRAKTTTFKGLSAAGNLSGNKPLLSGPRRTHRGAEVLRPRTVPLPLGRGSAHRPPRGLHGHRHRRALQAGPRLQRAPPDCWDAFGLPAEQHAVRTGAHPAANTRNNIANFKRQIKALGFSTTGNREINTTDPSISAGRSGSSSSSSGGASRTWTSARLVVSGNEDGARERGDRRREERGGRLRGRAPQPAPVGLEDHRLRGAAAFPGSEALDGPTRRSGCRRHGSAEVRERRSSSALRRPRLAN